ncbi:carbon-nitrogen hydrolase family protein [Effusibacillus lacus]|uniref:Aminohydrolase n=1 Tax=Effusibacillus lacus TaxID=1348429 RepID=A0A292YCK2_9BACL|nr:carbon-nitrogen hydrolase family protein [Effusibacillus lacus]TCS72822.1 putative amidohydrolase [Effusibacillus lacus]GAX89252.1 aminohydrolase [Effusibacillus lacus]
MSGIHTPIVAAVQMNCVLGDKTENLKKALFLIEDAVQQGAKLIVLPELFNTGYRVEERDPELAEPIPGPTTQWMSRLSQKHHVYLIGCILEKSVISGLVYDTAVVVGPHGLVGFYRKVHLWDTENTRFAKGEEFPVFDLGFARLGVQICYEIGFPEGSRILALNGADIVVYPSAFGQARRYAWDLATRSRALENGVFVIASNRTGIEKGETAFGGGSRIVNPQGMVLREALSEDEALVAEIDLSLVETQRRTIPYLRDLNKSIILKSLSNNPG